MDFFNSILNDVVWLFSSLYEYFLSVLSNEYRLQSFYYGLGSGLIFSIIVYISIFFQSMFTVFLVKLSSFMALSMCVAFVVTSKDGVDGWVFVATMAGTLFVIGFLVIFTMVQRRAIKQKVATQS